MPDPPALSARDRHAVLGRYYHCNDLAELQVLANTGARELLPAAHGTAPRGGTTATAPRGGARQRRLAAPPARRTTTPSVHRDERDRKRRPPSFDEVYARRCASCCSAAPEPSGRSMRQPKPQDAAARPGGRTVRAMRCSATARQCTTPVPDGHERGMNRRYPRARPPHEDVMRWLTLQAAANGAGRSRLLGPRTPRRFSRVVPRNRRCRPPRRGPRAEQGDQPSPLRC